MSIPQLVSYISISPSQQFKWYVWRIDHPIIDEWPACSWSKHYSQCVTAANPDFIRLSNFCDGCCCKIQITTANLNTQVECYYKTVVFFQLLSGRLISAILKWGSLTYDVVTIAMSRLEAMLLPLTLVSMLWNVIYLIYLKINFVRLNEPIQHS